MAHAVHVYGLKETLEEGTFSNQEIVDAIDSFFDGPDSSFAVYIVMNGADPEMRGFHLYTGRGHHSITIYRGSIERAIARRLPMGGNVTVPLDLRAGLALVLAHEIRHATQSAFHGIIGNTALYRGKYLGRPCEVDARRFVDEKFSQVMALIGRGVRPNAMQSRSDRKAELDQIVSIFRGEESVSRNDLTVELSYSRVPNESGLRYLVRSLTTAGVKVA